MTARPAAVAARGPLRLLYARRALLFSATRVELRRRFAGSLLGPAWTLLQPLLFFAAYAAVYAGVFRVSVPGMSATGYALHLFAGLLPCLFLAEACGAGVHAVTGNAPAVRNALFPPALLPARAVLVAAAMQAPALAALLLTLAATGRLAPAALLFPVVAALALLFAAGCAFALSSMNVLVRDVGHVAPLALFALVVLAPVAWSGPVAPPALALLLRANPLHPFVASTQALLVAGRLPGPVDLALTLLYALAALQAGHAIFRRLEPAFQDHL